MSEPLSPAPPPGPPPVGGGYAPPPSSNRPGLPWDNSKDVGSLLATTKRLITSPSRAYAEMKEKGDYAGPLIFALVFIVVCAVLVTVWQILGLSVSTFFMEWAAYLNPDMGDLGAMTAVGGASAVLGILYALVISLVGLFIVAGILHLTLHLLGGLKDSTAGFEGSFRVVCFAQVAGIVTVLPTVGEVLRLLWVIVLCILGLAAVHRSSQGKAVGAVIIPIALCCGLLIGGFAMGALFAGAFGALGY